MTPLERLRTLINELATIYGDTSLGNALETWKKWIEDDNKIRNILVISPVENTKIKTDFEYAGVVKGLEWYSCPNCGLVFNIRTNAGAVCPNCGRLAVPAYVGAPVPLGPIQPFFAGTQTEGTSLITSVVDNQGTRWWFWCPNRQISSRKLRVARGSKPRGYISTDPRRPMMSLRPVCHVPEVREGELQCPYYGGGEKGLCNFEKEIKGRSSIFFNISPPSRQLEMIPVYPSEELTKPFVLTVHSFSENEDTSTFDIGTHLKDVLKYGDLIKEAKFGNVEVWELQLFYTVGPPTAPRRYRVPVLLADLDGGRQYRIPGRRISTQGLFIELEFKRLSEVAEELSKRFGGRARYDEFTIVHSFTHSLMNAIVNTAGVSEEEIGESIFFSKTRQVAEIVVYDNAPGGVDGVRAALRHRWDLLLRLFRSARECPRRCRSACRACVFSVSCSYMNTKLSWLVSHSLLDWSKLRVIESLLK
jgi:hypothetical protein